MRYRFENLKQSFDLKKDDIFIFPTKELGAAKEKFAKDFDERIWAEIPAIIYPGSEDKVKEELKRSGVRHAVCENIGSVQIAKELGMIIHGGMFLNILNSDAIGIYAQLGLSDVMLSPEINYNEAKKLKADLPFGITVYGYIPLMKFRACPGNCASCNGQSEIVDRLGEKFTLICRDKKYSELLNCVPLYVADRAKPSHSFELVYFTKENPKEALRVRDLILAKAEFSGRKTSGLAFRELL